MKIQVLGPGCKRCEQLHQNALDAAGRITNAAEPLQVEKVKELDALYKLGVFVTPALVIDGEVVSAGKLLDTEQVESELRSRLG